MMARRREAWTRIGWVCGVVVVLLLAYAALEGAPEQIGMVASLLLGVSLGGLITWWVSRYYYQRAGQDLAREVAKLRQLNIMTINVLEAAGIAQVSRDATGKPIGLRYTFQVDEQVTVSDKARAFVVPQDPQRSTE
jgi:cobalamin synthase